MITTARLEKLKADIGKPLLKADIPKDEYDFTAADHYYFGLEEAVIFVEEVVQESKRLDALAAEASPEVSAQGIGDIFKVIDPKNLEKIVAILDALDVDKVIALLNAVKVDNKGCVNIKTNLTLQS